MEHTTSAHITTVAYKQLTTEALLFPSAVTSPESRNVN